MAKQKRVNPARRPLSEAALKDAKARYTSAGLNVGIELMLWVLIDKHDAPLEDVQQLLNEMIDVADVADSITKGYVDLRDIEKTLLEEYNVEVELDTFALLRRRS